MSFIADSLNRIGERISELIGTGFWDFAISIFLILTIYFGSKLVRSRLREYARGHVGIDNSFPALIDNVVRVLLLVLMAAIVFSAFGVDSASLVTFLGFATAAIALSLQDVLRNIFCGIYLLAEQPFQNGDRIRLLTEEGWVERIDLRVTRIRNDRQELVLIPNQTVFNQVVSNRSTRRSRPFTLELTGIESSIDVAEASVRTVIDAVTDGAGDPTILLKQSSPDGISLEITCRRTASETHQDRIARALIDAFPGATLTVLAR